MKIGFGTNLTASGVPIVDVAKAAESLGYESMWMGEHIMIPVENRAMRHGAPLPETYRHMPDPFVWLAAAAVSTKRLKLGTNICLVPQHDPIHLAKTVASLDCLSGGRVLLGIGSGWMEEEAPIMGYPFKQRWAKTMECLRAMKNLWTQDEASFSGEFVSFPRIYSYPKPVQKPHPPILIGAGNPASNNIHSLKRVVEIADGWQPGFFSPAQIKEHLGTLKTLCAAAGRDYARLDITLLVPAVNLGVGERFKSMGAMEATPRDAQEVIAEYEEAGVGRLIVGFADLTAETGIKVLEQAARSLKLH
jgi:probable F420-dependent oxidoreductase